jgi:hypothetical protein
LPRAHVRRLRELYRSAGWPCLDTIEVDLLAAGLLQRDAIRAPDGSWQDTLRVTDAGIAAMAAGVQRNRAAFDAHEALVALVVRQMQRGGRTAFTQLSLRAPVPAEEGRPRWVVAKPDVFSVRHTTVAGYLAPTVHEVKARRADLLGELRSSPRTEAKRAAYLAMSSECWYVLGLDARGRPIGTPDEIPNAFGVLQAWRLTSGDWRLEALRPAPRRALPHDSGLPFSAWMALARAIPAAASEDHAQGRL